MVSRGKRRPEPDPLKRGKAFHLKIQAEWESEAEGDVFSERWVIKKTGRKGRVDVFVNDDDPDGCTAIVEIKASEWDRMTDQAVKRNIRRQIRQVWGYIETQIDGEDYVSTGEHKSVSPGILFPIRPKDAARLEMIERQFVAEGIVVVWHDETIEECRRRHDSQ